MYGIAGAVATGLSMLLGNGIIMNVYYHRYMNLNIVHFGSKLRPICSYDTVNSSRPVCDSSYRFKQFYLHFVISMLLYSFIYFGVQWISNFNSYEKNLFYSFF